MPGGITKAKVPIAPLNEIIMLITMVAQYFTSNPNSPEGVVAIFARNHTPS